MVMRTVLMAIKILAWSLLAVQLATTAALLVVNHTNSRVIYITGGSMEPTYSIGDAVLIDVSGRVPSAGENVTFTSSNGILTTHRVVSLHDVKGVPHLRTQGDANEDPDSDLVPLASIKGISGQSFPLAGYALAWLISPVGRLLTFGPILLFFGVREVLAVRDHARDSSDAGSEPAGPGHEGHTRTRGRRRSATTGKVRNVKPGRREPARSPSRAARHRSTA